jgi:hypothetical protein
LDDFLEEVDHSSWGIGPARCPPEDTCLSNGRGINPPLERSGQSIFWGVKRRHPIHARLPIDRPIFPHFCAAAMFWSA